MCVLGRGPLLEGVAHRNDQKGNQQSREIEYMSVSVMSLSVRLCAALDTIKAVFDLAYCFCARFCEDKNHLWGFFR